MRAFTAVFLLSIAMPAAFLGCTEEAPPPKMPEKVYIPWLVKKKPAPTPSTTVVTTATAPEPAPDTPDEPSEDATP